MDLWIPHFSKPPNIPRYTLKTASPWDRKGTASDSDSSELLFGSGALQNITRMDISISSTFTKKNELYIIYWHILTYTGLLISQSWSIFMHIHITIPGWKHAHFTGQSSISWLCESSSWELSKLRRGLGETLPTIKIIWTSDPTRLWRRVRGGRWRVCACKCSSACCPLALWWQDAVRLARDCVLRNWHDCNFWRHLHGD